MRRSHATKSHAVRADSGPRRHGVTYCGIEFYGTTRRKKISWWSVKYDNRLAIAGQPYEASCVTCQRLLPDVHA